MPIKDRIRINYDISIERTDFSKRIIKYKHTVAPDVKYRWSLSDWELYPALCDKAMSFVKAANNIDDEILKKELVKKALQIDAEYRAWHSDNVLGRNSFHL